MAYADDWNMPPVNSDNCTKVLNGVWGVFDFHHACQHHDACYYYHWAGDGFSGRWTCDAWFFWDMFNSCSGWTAWMCESIAGLYWIGVRAYGADAFARHGVGATWVEILSRMTHYYPGLPGWFVALFQ